MILIVFSNQNDSLILTKPIVLFKSYARVSSILRICYGGFVAENILPLKEIVLFWSSLFLNKFSY